MLKVLLDARKLGDGGIGTYISNLVHGLIHAPEISVVLLVAKGKRGAFFPSLQVEQIEDSSTPYSLDETFLFARRITEICKSFNIDIFHEPHFTLPQFLKTASVITIHDIIQITNPERWYYPPIARFLIKRAIHGANKIIVVSDATKTALLKAFPNISSLHGKLEVIPNAMAQDLLEDPVDFQALLKERFNLEPGYLFALFSMLKPHKGFSDLIEAYKRASSATNIPKLVIAGKGLANNALAGSGLLARLNELGVQTLGEVTEHELAALYKGARATVLPSRIEGFGLSALEAKVLGSPLLLRPLPSFSSIADSADLICSDLSVSALATALESIERNIAAWQIRPRNTALAAAYSIESVTTKTIEVYKDVLLSQ